VEDEQEGIPHLVNKSLQTTRRFDALKLYISLQTIGRKQFAAFIEQTIEVARATAQQIIAHPRLELLNPAPMLTALVFRYLSAEDHALENRINAMITKRMFREGKAVLGQTEIKGKKCLKMTLLNPLTTQNITTKVIEQVVELGKRLEQEERERDGQPDHC
jgi:L-2,4-diaminobutyrate decarboxylase